MGGSSRSQQARAGSKMNTVAAVMEKHQRKQRIFVEKGIRLKNRSAPSTVQQWLAAICESVLWFATLKSWGFCDKRCVSHCHAVSLRS